MLPYPFEINTDPGTRDSRSKSVSEKDTWDASPKKKKIDKFLDFVGHQITDNIGVWDGDYK